MIRVHVKNGLLGEGPRRTQEMPWRPGLTVGELRRQVEGEMPAGTQLGVAVHGRKLDDGDEIPDGADVLVAGIPDGEILAFVAYLLISAALSVAISYAMQALVPLPKPPGVPQERGDDSSPTASWEGVTTSFGQGFTIPVVLGRHLVGGQVIYTDVDATVAGGSLSENLRLILALSEGPIYRIGDQLAREADGLGGYQGWPAGPAIPDHIRVNDNLLDSSSSLPGARLWLRPGTLDQSPLPAPFVGATSTFSVGQRLDEAGQEAIFSYVGTDEIDGIVFVFAAPAGIYQQDNQGNISAFQDTSTNPATPGVRVQLEWRPDGQSAWRPFYRRGTNVQVSTFTFGQQPRFGQFVETVGAELGPNGQAQRGPFEVRVRRLTPTGSSTTTASSIVWRSVATNIDQPFAYPGVALLGFDLVASSRVSGQIPGFKVRVDGVLVRVWDPVHGFSPPCWDVPAAPFDFNVHPPGRNPAWLAGAFLRARWGLGEYFDDSKIDWPALRRWAAFCDSAPYVGATEPRFTFDAVLDASRPAWEILLQICAAGRCAPIWRNGQVSFVYRYRDAHSDLGLAVPAKAPVQLLTSSLCEDVQVRWLPRGQRPTVYQFQFLNEEQLWTQDVLTEEDPEATFNDQSDPSRDAWRPEVLQAYGETRPAQLRRRGVWMHRVNRLVRRELSFRCGPWLLAAEVGDNVLFEHDVLRPFGGDVPLAMQVIAGGTGVTQVTVDHPVAGVGLALAARTPTGAPVYRLITSATPTTGGTILAFAAAADIATGATIAVGLADKITEEYEIVGITLEQDMRREVRALQWDPAVYDTAGLDISGDVGPGPSTLLRQPNPAANPSLATDLSLAPAGNGRQVLGWHRPAGRSQARARVYARDAMGDAWRLLGDTTADQLEVAGLAPWRAYELAVTLESPLGDFAPPEASARATLTAEEFPALSPPAPTNGQVTLIGPENRARLSWDFADQRQLEAYEVRCGDDWAAGVVVYRGRESAIWLEPPMGHGIYQIAARAKSGLYGPRLQVWVDVEACAHNAQAKLVDEIEHWPTLDGSGTHSNTEVDTTTDPASPFLALQAGKTSGTYTADEVDLGFEGPFFLRVAHWAQELDQVTVGESTWGCGSGEARWRTCGTRPASAGMPGIDWSTLIQDLTMTIADLPDDFLVGGSLGEVGSHTLCRIESRVYQGGLWSAWAPHVDRLVVCSKWQVRVVLGRRTTTYAIRCRRLYLTTLI